MLRVIGSGMKHMTPISANKNTTLSSLSLAMPQPIRAQHAQLVVIGVKPKSKHVKGEKNGTSKGFMSLVQLKAHDSDPNHLEYHILLAIDGQSLSHSQDFCQSYQKRGSLFPTILELERM